MPELPEVETVVNQLRPIIVGQTLEEIKVFDQKLKINGAPFGKIDAVTRLGKKIIFRILDNEIAIHLRMTGRFSWIDNQNENNEIVFSKLFKHYVPLKHLRIAFRLSSGFLNFYDPRRFGTVEFGVSGDFIPTGFDPTSENFSLEILSTLLKRKIDIKTFLLEQKYLVGIGNIYASEILYDAKICPFIKACELDLKQIVNLHYSIKKILGKAIKAGGTTISDFQHLSGASGGFQNFLCVYEQKKCKNCNVEITRVVQKQRSTYYCKFCQPQQL